MPIRIRVDGKETVSYERTRNRVIFEGGVYHIIQRAPGKEVLFCENQDYQYFMHLLARTKKEFGVSFFCYSFLPNHVHLLLQIHQENLSEAMKHLFESHAKYFNKKYKRKGHVFCGPFRAMVCDTERYLLAASVYINLNAFKAGLCKTMADYKWHSIARYFPNSNKDELVESDFVLSMLHEDRGQAYKEYQRVLEVVAKRPAILGGAACVTSKTVQASVHSIELSFDKTISALLPNKSIRKKTKEELAKYKRITELRNQGLSRENIQEELGISKATYFRILQRIEKVYCIVEDV